MKYKNKGVIHNVSILRKIKKFFFPKWVEAEDSVVKLTEQVKCLKKTKDIYIINKELLKQSALDFKIEGQVYMEINNSLFVETKIDFISSTSPDTMFSLFGDNGQFHSCIFQWIAKEPITVENGQKIETYKQGK